MELQSNGDIALENGIYILKTTLEFNTEFLNLLFHGFIKLTLYLLIITKKMI